MENLWCLLFPGSPQYQHQHDKHVYSLILCLLLFHFFLKETTGKIISKRIYFQPLHPQTMWLFLVGIKFSMYCFHTSIHEMQLTIVSLVSYNIPHKHVAANITIPPLYPSHGLPLQHNILKLGGSPGLFQK